jgi:predicted ATP-grasp superfamily ATP-dependent carboligase
MHVLLYEFIAGGGWLFVEPHARPHGSLLREGLAMISAIAADFAALADMRVSIFWDARLALPRWFESTANCHVQLIHSTGEHDEQLAKLAARSDHTLLIAPEFDGHLARVVGLAESAGARLLSPNVEFIELATDKHSTLELLAQRGVAVPHGIALEIAEPLPDDFPFPAVLKPRDGAGSQGVALWMQHPGEDYRASAPMRLEKFIAGQPASAAAICGPAGHVLLPPSEQRLSSDGTFAYHGGATPLAGGLAVRAQKLAEQTLAALPPALGYVGIDMVLGPCQSSDTVIEVNPRLTTSYIGLRHIVRENLALAMLQIASGHPPVLSLRPGRLEFNAAGEVTWINE